MYITLNMKKSIVIFALFLLFAKAETVSADYLVAGTSAQLKVNVREENVDYRTIMLKNYLASHSSPLSDYSDTFIAVADKYDLDWRLIPAIAGVESTFGKRIPFESYNAYGWANGKYQFSSWDESIEVVGKTLREKYIDRGATTVAKIAKIYAPPSVVWGKNVNFFMGKIDSTRLEFSI